MGPFPGNERTWKPFNPILGETFELGMENGLKFIAEQVEAYPEQATLASSMPHCIVMECTLLRTVLHGTQLKLHCYLAVLAPCVACQI